MKLVVFTICLCFTAAESREYARRVLHDDTGDVSLESQESVDILPSNSVLTPAQRTLETGKAESKENKSGLDVHLKANHAVMPSGDKVDIPESIQGYRKCFGDENLKKIMEWIIDVCKKGLCNGTFKIKESGGGHPQNLVEPAKKDSKEQGQSQVEKESFKEAEETKIETKTKKGTEETKTSSKSKKKDETVEDGEKTGEADTDAEDNDKGGRKEIGSGQSAKSSKVIPYKRERSELENVTFQFKALPSKEKDRFCKYLENDLLADPMATLKMLLGRIQFGDKKESGVHYDRNRGAILAGIQSRRDRETQILKWACEDRRDGQRKLYFPVKRYLPGHKRAHKRKSHRRYSAGGSPVVPFFKPTYPYEGHYPRETYRPYRTAPRSDPNGMEDAEDDTMDTMDTVYVSDSDDVAERGESGGSAEDGESEIDNDDEDNIERKARYISRYLQSPSWDRSRLSPNRIV